MSDILIIGGGVSGLSAGIYAQLNGHHAIVCERHFLPGGNLTGWNREGYHIDNCIHWLTGTNPKTDLYKMWVELGALGDVNVILGESLYTCEKDGKSLSLYRDLNRLREEMLKISPEDKKEINSLIRTVEALEGFFGIKGEEHDKGFSLSDALVCIPSLVKYYRLSTKDLSKRFKHPLLKSFIISFFGEDFGSLALLFVMAHFCADNGGIPEGGSLLMAKRMANRLTSLGGELLLNKEVVSVDHEDGVARSVSFSDGTSRELDYVVVTTDPEIAFERLIKIPMPTQLKKKYENRMLKRFSSYQCAFACDFENPPFVGDLIFEVPERLRDKVPLKQVIVREFSHDKSFYPEGKCVLQTMTFCSEEIAQSFIELKAKNKEAYLRKKRLLAKMLEEILVARFPEMKGKLKCLDLWTPASYKRFVASKIGSWMSFILPAKMIPLRDCNRVRGIKNLILATQWQQIPGGLPTAAECGRAAVKTILRLENGVGRVKAPVLLTE